MVQGAVVEQSDIERFWIKVDMGSKEECWNFLGGINQRGYGNFWLNGRIVSAHRVAWEILHKQPVPDELHILHRCNNKACCNPYHLYSGTHSDNMGDACSSGLMCANIGEDNPSAKLKVEDVRNIRKLYKNGNHTQAEIAEQYNLNPTYIHSIVRYKRWKNV